MPTPLYLLSIPGLRRSDVELMPRLQSLVKQGAQATLAASVPALTCPVQANLTTGVLPNRHGVIANGFFWRDRDEVEMWTAWNDCILAPQIWTQLRSAHPSIKTAVWFAMHSKGCSADLVCTPAPIHNPDGSESLWCYTRPEAMYGELRDALGHFPLKNFWGPLTSIASTAWIVDSVIWAAKREQPDFAYVYLPHLDYAAQRSGPDSPQAIAALGELDGVLGELIDECQQAYGDTPVTWLIASEYVIQPVTNVIYPNRVLRELDLLEIEIVDGLELLDVGKSAAWALVDHQLTHIFVRDRDPLVAARIADRFRKEPSVAQVLLGDDRDSLELNHARSGDIVLISAADSWFAYYWWLDDALAPPFARTVDIHRKPGYDPVELFFEPASRSIPLDATLVRGSHGAPVPGGEQGVLLSSHGSVLGQANYRDIDICRLVLDHFAG